MNSLEIGLEITQHAYSIIEMQLGTVLEVRIYANPKVRTFRLAPVMIADDLVHRHAEDLRSLLSLSINCFFQKCSTL